MAELGLFGNYLLVSIHNNANAWEDVYYESFGNEGTSSQRLQWMNQMEMRSLREILMAMSGLLLRISLGVKIPFENFTRSDKTTIQHLI